MDLRPVKHDSADGLHTRSHSRAFVKKKGGYTNETIYTVAEAEEYGIAAGTGCVFSGRC